MWSASRRPSPGPVERSSFMQVRMRTWLSSLLFAGCVVPANNPPPQYGYQPPPQYAQQDPPPAAPPQSDPYQPPPAQPPYQPPPPPPAPPPPPPPATYSDPTYSDLNVDVDGNDVPSVDVFYDQLAPHGTWYDDPTYGWVFAPGDASYVPYTNGRWTSTEYGFTWVSSDPF